MSIITRRKHQVGFRRGDLCGEQIIGGVVFCETTAGARNWARRLNKMHPTRFNYFVLFRDGSGSVGLQFSFASWASVDRPYFVGGREETFA